LDDLNTPLAAAPVKRRWPLPRVTIPQASAGVLGVFLAVFAGWALMVNDPLGGEPVVMLALQPSAKTAPAHDARLPAGVPKSGAASADTPHPAGAAQVETRPAAQAPNGKVITIIDGSSGKRQEIVIPGAPDKKKEKQAGGPPIDERLLEATRHGRIPKIAANGARAVEVYSRPLAPAEVASDAPRIAIVMVGLGIGASTTVDALSRLPPAVSLAFVPYGAELESLVRQARERGHEVLLQTPMEPFDYPDNDPGPRTLLTTLAREQNIDRLHWLMSRFAGYVGIANYMGAKFTASEKAFAPVLAEIAKRGLMYFDDGSSARSQAAHLAAANTLPFAKAEVSIDAVPAPAEIDRALLRLESIAREHGVAVGVANALPVTIDRIVRWERSLKAHGILLLPVTAVALKLKSS
jgi:polysaccharide deacetylase 2 family uncharacterized protein YibQ